MPKLGQPHTKLYDPTLFGARCDVCPLKGMGGPVQCEKNTDPKLVLVGESPAEWEVTKGHPFAGATGHYLNKLLKLYKIPRTSLHLTNAVLCAPPENFGEWKKAIACCRPRLIAELKNSPPRWVLALGDHALTALMGKSMKVLNWMGGVMTKHLNGSGEWSIVPAYHPSYIMRLEGAPYRPVTHRHYQRAWKLATGELAPWNWGEMHIEPGRKMVRALQRILSSKKPVGFDVETQGINPRTDKCMCLSIANEDVGICTPWEAYTNRHGSNMGLADYRYGRRIRQLVKTILEDESITKLMHNGQHDSLTVEKYGIAVTNWDDTMLAHAVLYPTIRHRLNDAACQFTHAPRWKDVFEVSKTEKGGEGYVQASAEALRLYCCKDSAIMPPLWAGLKEELSTRWPEAQEIYDKLFAITQEVAVPMSTRGLPIDLTKFKGHIKRLKAQARTPLRQLEVLWVMLESREMKVTPAVMAAAKRVAAQRKKHSNLSETAIIAKYLGIEMFNPDRSKHTHRMFLRHFGAPVVHRTNKGAPSLNATALTAYMGDSDPMLARAATLMLRYKKRVKLARFLLNRNINKVPIKEVSPGLGHCTPPWKTHGTKTGRWSSPIMIIPKPLRDIFLPHHKDGWVVECDWKQLELRIIAQQSGDKELLRQFDNGEDIYVAAARNIYQKKDISKNERALAKAFVLGRNYGGGDLKIWQQLRPKFPSLRIDDIAFARAQIESAHPELEVFRAKLLRDGRQLDYVSEPFDGRREYFYGSPEPTKILNFPQQGGGAALIRRVAIAIKPELDWPDEGILMQYHDALILDGPDPVRLYQLFHKHMRFQLGPMLYEIEVSVGRNWRDAVEVHSEGDIHKLMETT